MITHFTQNEFDGRMRRTTDAMKSQDLDGLLIFKQESMYWLTGYDTFGFCFFQCLVLTSDGRMALLTRSADLRQAQLTSIIRDIRVWVDSENADPTKDLRALLCEMGLRNVRIGVEFQTHALTAANGIRLMKTLGDATEAVDASLLVSRLRLVKSVAEIAYVKKAGEIADKSLDAALREAKPNGHEARVLAAMHEVGFSEGGDYPANPFVIGSDSQALLCRYKSGRRQLGSKDQLTLEWAGVYRQYHAACMRTIPIGEPTRRHYDLFGAAKEALLACEENLKPGKTMGDVFSAHAKSLDSAGLAAHRLNACGYSLGAVYSPSWMDWPMFYDKNPVVLEVGMVMFLHMIIMDSDTNTAMCLGRTSLIEDAGLYSLSRHPLELITGC